MLRMGGKLKVDWNDVLAQCLVDALVAQVEEGLGFGVGVSSVGNKNSCTCSEVDGVLVADCP